MRLLFAVLLVIALGMIGVAGVFFDAFTPERTDAGSDRRACDGYEAEPDREIRCLRDALQDREAEVGELRAELDDADELRAALEKSQAQVQQLEAQVAEVDHLRAALETSSAASEVLEAPIVEDMGLQADERPDAQLPTDDTGPSPPVEQSTDPPGDPAPLPDDAPEELRQVAALAMDGNAEAQHDLATAYAIGTTIPQNFERAAYWYGLSADGGIVNARYNLGVLTERGLGVEQDSEAGFAMFLEAANAGHPDAENAVGLAYMHGHGTERDVFEAAEWFQAASLQGNPRGAYHLGRLFEEGVLDGTPDLTAAAGWYRVAADAGDDQAAEALRRLGR